MERDYSKNFGQELENSKAKFERLKVEEKTKNSLLKHRGDVLAVTRETGFPLEYVFKANAKMQKSFGREVSLQISSTVSLEILTGRRQRIQYLVEMLRSLEGRDQLKVSLCCGKSFQEEVREGKKVTVCKKCTEICRVELRDREEIYRTKLEVIRELRAEEDKLVDWLVKMGFTNTQPIIPQPSTVIRNTQLILGDTSKMSGQEKQALVDLRELDPQDSERVVKQLESVLFKAKYYDANGNFIDPSFKDEDGKSREPRQSTPEAPAS